MHRHIGRPVAVGKNAVATALGLGAALMWGRRPGEALGLGVLALVKAAAFAIVATFALRSGRSIRSNAGCTSGRRCSRV